MAKIITEYPQFFTATCLEWKKVLKPDKYKRLVVESLAFLADEQRVIIYGFVVMINHVHIIWQMSAEVERPDLQRDFLKYTAQMIIKDLMRNHPRVLPYLLVNARDRKYQLWERNSLTVDIWSEKVLVQKLNYLHQNPVRAGICRFPDEYFYSSAAFYKRGGGGWKFLTHYRD